MFETERTYWTDDRLLTETYKHNKPQNSLAWKKKIQFILFILNLQNMFQVSSETTKWMSYHLPPLRPFGKIS